MAVKILKYKKTIAGLTIMTGLIGIRGCGRVGGEAVRSSGGPVKAYGEELTKSAQLKTAQS